MQKQSRQSLSELQADMKECRLCLTEGFEIYPPAVFSGQKPADFMTIGQAPGITEQEAQRPFNAGSGTRLFGWLERAGIEEEWFRSTQYICHQLLNVIQADNYPEVETEFLPEVNRNFVVPSWMMKSS